MNDSRSHMNIGAASVILLITVFALTVFAVLSIRASYNERGMAQRGRDAVERYYEADVRAEEIYGRLLAARREAGDGAAAQEILSLAEIPADILTQAEENLIVCEIAVDHNRTLRLVFELSKTGLSVKEWWLVSGTSGTYGEEIDIWDGIFTE